MRLALQSNIPKYATQQGPQMELDRLFATLAMTLDKKEPKSSSVMP